MGKGKLWTGLVLFAFAVPSLTFVGCQKKKEDDKVAQKGSKEKDETPKATDEPKIKIAPKEENKKPAKEEPPKKEPVKKEPVKKQPSKKEPPQTEDSQKQIVKVFDEAKTAVGKKDYDRLADLMTADSRKAVAGLLLAESVYLKIRKDNPTIAKAFPNLVKDYAPIAKALQGHKIGDAFFSKAADVKDLVAKWRSGGISKEQAEMAKKKFLDLAAMADIKSPSKFIGDYLNARGKQPFTAKAELANVKIDGDRATAIIREGTAEMPLAFQKVDDQWRLQVTPNLLSELLQERQAPTKDGES